MSEQDELTEDEKQMLATLAKDYGAPEKDEKHNVHTFLRKVLETPDTTRVGNLDATEVGLVKFPIRTLKDCSLIASNICEDDELTGFLNGESEIVTQTSLSKDAKLITLAVEQRRTIEDRTKRKKPNSGWFKKKDEDEVQ